MPNQGGSHEQHVKAGQQSHKNDDNNRQQGDSSRQQHAQDKNMGQQQGGAHRGGSGNFAEDPKRASDAGRKGGQS